MKIQVKLPSIFTEKESAFFHLELSEPSTVQKAVDQLNKQLGKKFSTLVIKADGGVDPMIAILVNGQNVVALDGLDTKLVDGDLLAIMHIVAGGD